MTDIKLMQQKLIEVQLIDKMEQLVILGKQNAQGVNITNEYVGILKHIVELAYYALNNDLTIEPFELIFERLGMHLILNNGKFKVIKETETSKILFNKE